MKEKIGEIFSFDVKKQFEKISELILRDGHIKSGEEVLVVTDTASDKLVLEIFLNTAYSLDISAKQIIMSYKATYHSNYNYYSYSPPKSVIGAMLNADMIYVMTIGHLISWYSPFLPKILKKARIIEVKPIKDYLLRVANSTIDLEKVRRKGEILKRKFNESNCMRVTSSKGTDVVVNRLRKNSAYCYKGEVFNAGEETYWPGGMIYSAFEGESVNGTIVLDGAMKMLGVLKEPIKLTVKDDEIINVEGGKQAKQFGKYIEEMADPHLPYVIHTGLGTNPGAITTDNVSELEAVDGAIIWGIGKQFWFFEKKDPISPEDRKKTAKNHFDPTMLNGNLWLDDELILKDGKYMLEELK